MLWDVHKLLYSLSFLLTALKVQLWELKVIKQTILLQNHWGERAQKYDSVSPCRQKKNPAVLRKSPNMVYCTVSISEGITNNVIGYFCTLFWNFSALMLLLHLFNVQVEINFKITLCAGIDWGTFALLWHRTKLRSWQMSLGETEFIPSPSVAEYKTISRVPWVASFQFLFSILWTLCSSEKPDSLKLLFIVTYLGC